MRNSCVCRFCRRLGGNRLHGGWRVSRALSLMETHKPMNMLKDRAGRRSRFLVDSLFFFRVVFRSRLF